MVFPIQLEERCCRFCNQLKLCGYFQFDDEDGEQIFLPICKECISGCKVYSYAAKEMDVDLSTTDWMCDKCGKIGNILDDCKCK